MSFGEHDSLGRGGNLGAPVRSTKNSITASAEFANQMGLMMMARQPTFGNGGDVGEKRLTAVPEAAQRREATTITSGMGHDTPTQRSYQSGSSGPKNSREMRLSQIEEEEGGANA